MKQNSTFFFYYRFYLIIIAVGLLVFGMSFGNAFVWDDEEQVVNNSAFHSLTSIPSLFLGSTFNTGGSGGNLSGMYYKPMMSLVFTLLYTIFGARAGWFHLVQVSLHIINACLVFAIFNLLLLGKKERTSYAALFLALAFLIHPLQVESAVYISALQDVLFLLFGLWGLYRLIAFNLKKTTDYVWLGTLLLLSLLSKETGILFIPVVLLYAYLFKKPKDTLLSIINISFIVGVAYAVLRFGIARVYGAKEGLSPIMRVGLGTRLLTAPKVISYYLQNSIWPQNLAIAQHWVVRQATWQQFYLPLGISLTLVIGLIVWLLHLKKKHHDYFLLALFFSAWFSLGLGLHLHVIPLDMTVADRWFYFPILGLLGLLAVAWQSLATKKLEVLALGLAIFLVIILSARSIIRVLDWKNGLTLFSHDIAISQNAFDLENNLGVELFRAGQFEAAKPHFETSIKLAPYWWSNYNNLGAYYNRRGNLVQAEKLYKKAIANSDYYLAYINLAGILLRQEKFEEAQQFLEQEALPRFPHNPELLKFWQYAQMKQNQNQAE